MQKSCLHSNIRSSFLTLCGWLLLYFNSSVGPFKKITWKKFSFIIAARKALEKSFLPHFPSFSYFRQHVLAINHWKWGSAQRGKIWEMFFTPWIYQKLCCLFIFCHLIWFGVRNDTVMDLPTHCYYYCEVCVCASALAFQILEALQMWGFDGPLLETKNCNAAIFANYPYHSSSNSPPV